MPHPFESVAVLGTAPRDPVSQDRHAHAARERVVAVLPRGEAIRNFVYSHALDQLARDVNVSVLSVYPSQEIAHLMQERYSEVYELEPVRERWTVRILRDVLDLAHGRWLWSEASQERWRLRDVEAITMAQKLKRLAKKAAVLPLANRPGLTLLSRAENTASRKLRTSDRYVNLLRDLQPSLVFNGSHVHSNIAAPVIHAAQILGIPTAAFIFSWDNLTSQGRIMPPYDYYLVWNESLRRQLLEMYPAVRPEDIFVTGTPQFDFHFRPEAEWSREEFCARVGADATRPIVLYSTGMANHMPGEPQIVEGIARMLREMPEFGPPQLLVRVYAKDRTGRFDAVKERLPDVLFPPVPWEPNWLTPKPEDSYLLANTLRHAAVGINVASTISLELCMFDKPVLNVGYNPPGVAKEQVDYSRYYQFDHYRPIVESGAVRVAYSESALREQMIDALRSPERQSDNRKKLIRQFFGDTLDGHSAIRIAQTLRRLAERKLYRA